jgi:hypothetical protein
MLRDLHLENYEII